jgi:hypothetical protein
MNLKNFMEVVKYRVTEGSSFGWNCYGDNSYCLDSWDGVHDGHSISVVFDRADQTVYEMTACDFHNDRAYRWINPDFVAAHLAEAESRGNIAINEAWDEVMFTDLDVEEDFLQKADAISMNRDYDTRVMITLDLEEYEIVSLMKLAHEKDLTLNELVAAILESAIDEFDKANAPD